MTIRAAAPSDTDAIVALWLEASIQAHNFVPASFWQDQTDAMREVYLPAAETYVEEEGGRIRGFASLVGDDLAALFVEPFSQGCGVGAALLRHAQSARHRLTTTVYLENPRALAFYSRHGFIRSGEQTDVATGAPEATLVWSR